MISRIPYNDCPEKAEIKRDIIDFYERADIEYERMRQEEVDNDRRNRKAKIEDEER